MKSSIISLLQPPCRNDNSCRGCKKRHVTLYVCDSCPAAICPDCLSQSEKYILEKRYFFCKSCMEDPPLHMNRFAPTSIKLTLFAQDWQMASSLHQSLGFSTTVPIIALASVSSLIGGEKELANKEPMLDNKGTLRIQSLPFSLSIPCINCILNNPTNTFVFFRSLLFHRTNNH